MMFVCLFSFFFFTSTDEVKDLLLTETRFNTFRLQVANFLPLIVKRGTFSLLAEALIDLKGESHGRALKCGQNQNFLCNINLRKSIQ